MDYLSRDLKSIENLKKIELNEALCTEKQKVLLDIYYRFDV